MKRIFNYVLKHKVLLIVPSIAMLIGIIADMFNPYFAKVIIGDVIQEGKSHLLLGALIGLLVVTVSRTILGYVKEYLFDILSAEVNKDIKQELFDHIQSIPFSYFDSMNTGELMSRINRMENIWKTFPLLRLFIENIIILC